MSAIYTNILKEIALKKPLLAVLIDPEKFEIDKTGIFLKNIPKEATHIFVGGSTSETVKITEVVSSIKKQSVLPVILFPGDANQVTGNADAILFLSLLSGRNPEYLIEQQIKAVPKLKATALEIIPTGYILIDGGKQSAVEQVSNTKPILQSNVETVTDTALAGQYLGKKLIYLEAGSGALHRVNNKIIAEVKQAIQVPLIVGGGITSVAEMREVYKCGADMVVIGTAFETHIFEN